MEPGEPAVDFLSRRLPRTSGGPLPALELRRTGRLGRDAAALLNRSRSYLAMGPRQKPAASTKRPVRATCHRPLRVGVGLRPAHQRPPDRSQGPRRVSPRLEGRKELHHPRPPRRRVRTQARTSRSVRSVRNTSTWALHSSTLSR
ncbi:unnamed protein product, partial [Ectocarpus sp. 12 AP-2014]